MDNVDRTVARRRFLGQVIGFAASIPFVANFSFSSPRKVPQALLGFRLAVRTTDGENIWCPITEATTINGQDSSVTFKAANLDIRQTMTFQGVSLWTPTGKFISSMRYKNQGVDSQIPVISGDQLRQTYTCSFDQNVDPEDWIEWTRRLAPRIPFWQQEGNYYAR